MKMRTLLALVILIGSTSGLAGCVSIVDPVDRDMSLPNAKIYTQSIEREIAGAMPEHLVSDVKQKATGTFLPCSRGGGQQWAGGLTARTQPGVSANELLDPVEKYFADRGDLTTNRRVEDEDTLIDVAGPHNAFWILRYDPVSTEIRIVSFSPCIYLPDGVWRGDKY